MRNDKEKRRNAQKKKRRIRGTILVLLVILGFSGIFYIYSHLKQSQKGEARDLADASHHQESVKETLARPQKAETKPVIEQAQKKEPADVQEKNKQEKTAGVEKQKESEDTTNKKVVYITFDDGPCATTPKLLDVLDQYNVKATFFVTAQFMNDEDLVKQLKEIHDRGHVVAVHSYTHDYGQIYSSVDAFMADYKKMDDLIYEATGEHSRIFRFPGGSNTGYNSSIRKNLLEEVKKQGLIYHDWNAYDGDCDGYKGEDLIKRAVQESSYTNRSILLMHNIPGKDTVIESLPEIIKQLQAAGYTFDVIDENVKPIQFA